MEYLYVCLFSSGHIKVGRSVDPDSRIAAHADRVACMGIELSEHITFQCIGSASQAEVSLIARCNQVASCKHGNEWFAGLDFLEVTAWAKECALKVEGRRFSKNATELPPIDYDRPDFQLILAHLKVAGKTQTEIAEACGCRQSTISDIANERTKEPSYGVGSALVRMARAVVV